MNAMIADTEDMRIRRRFAIVVVMFTVLFVVLMGRFFWIQIVRGDEYRERARVSFTTTERLPARRGKILDQNGEVLAKNVAAFHLKILPHALRDPAVRAPVMNRLAAILTLTHAEKDQLEHEIEDHLENKQGWIEIELGRPLVSTTCPYDGNDLALVTPETAAANALLQCPVCGIVHEAVTGDAERCPHDGARLTWDADKHSATCPKCKRSYVTAPVCPNDGGLLQALDHNLQCPECKRRFTDEVAVLKSSLSELPGVHIETEFVRTYPQPFIASHLLGYMNLVTAEDRAASPGVYPLDARVGRAGVEAALESVLRGRAGEAEYFKGADKSLVRGFRPAESGLDVRLTIDAKLQREVRQAMRYQRSGAAVALDPRTGAVLALYSTPGYDPNVWSQGIPKDVWEETAANPYHPMMNKALTAFAPGSVYKIVTSLAGLDLGLVTPEDTMHCPGYYEFAGRRFRCHARSGHGYVNMEEAIKGSCDVYFYKLGEKIGMDRLAHYGEMFGFGEATGIEIGERTGRVPTKAFHETTPLGFQPGLTLSTAIGQGALTASPLQVARAFAAVANGGHLMQARLVDAYLNENGQVVQRFLPVEEARLAATPEELATIREGLVRVVNDSNGTGKEARLDTVVVAGKTGTAEAAQSRPGADEELRRWLKDDHAWFAAYAPADDPQIVVVVFLEHGRGGGHNAAPVAKVILEAWLRLGLYHPRPIAPGDLEDDEHAGHDHGGDLDHEHASAGGPP
ncbi:MAG: penicillin-binding protein 2 [Deltaproteobacteria bacterium]|nr:penicillin-binding protein 2 [Deltaproteobacteria bacterium]